MKNTNGGQAQGGTRIANKVTRSSRVSADLTQMALQRNYRIRLNFSNIQPTKLHRVEEIA